MRNWLQIWAWYVCSGSHWPESGRLALSGAASRLSPGGGGVCSVEQTRPAQRLDNSEPQKAFLLHCCCDYSEQAADSCLNKSTLWPIIKITPLKTPAPLQVPQPWVIPLSTYSTSGPLQQKGQSKHHADCCHFKPVCISITPGPLFILYFPRIFTLTPPPQ